jgi:hypothetical protein
VVAQERRPSGVGHREDALGIDLGSHFEIERVDIFSLTPFFCVNEVHVIAGDCKRNFKASHGPVISIVICR